MEMTDESLMPFGRYKGMKLANVPASYLLFINEQSYVRGHLKNYITNNLDVLKEQAKEEALTKKQ